MQVPRLASEEVQPNQTWNNGKLVTTLTYYEMMDTSETTSRRRGSLPSSSTDGANADRRGLLPPPLSSSSKDYINDLDTAYDSPSKTAEDHVPILEYMKFLMTPVVVSVTSQQQGVGKQQQKETQVNPEFVNIVGLATATLISGARHQIQEKSEEVWKPSWSRGKINNEDFGYIPPLALLLCLPEKRLHDAAEDDLKKIVKETKCVDLLKDALKLWSNENRFIKLMSRHKFTVELFESSHSIECLKATIFVMRVYAAQQFLNPSSRSSSDDDDKLTTKLVGLDRADHYLQLMNRHIKVTSEEIMEWNDVFEEISRRRKQRRLQQQEEQEHTSNIHRGGETRRALSLASSSFYSGSRSRCGLLVGPRTMSAAGTTTGRNTRARAPKAHRDGETRRALSLTLSSSSSRSRSRRASPLGQRERSVATTTSVRNKRARATCNRNNKKNDDDDIDDDDDDEDPSVAVDEEDGEEKEGEEDKTNEEAKAGDPFLF